MGKSKKVFKYRSHNAKKPTEQGKKEFPKGIVVRAILMLIGFITLMVYWVEKSV